MPCDFVRLNCDLSCEHRKSENNKQQDKQYGNNREAHTKPPEGGGRRPHSGRTAIKTHEEESEAEEDRYAALRKRPYTENKELSM